MSTLLSKVLEIRPKSGQTLNTFGWECDGAVINGIYSFIFTSLVAYAIINGVSSMPQPMARALGAIQTQYKKHSNAEQRLLSSLVESQAQRFANRSMNDPFFLAAELQRAAYVAQHVRAFVKLYRARTSVNAALSLPQRVEDVVVNIMTEKVAHGTKQIMTRLIAKHGWDEGPINVYLLLHTNHVEDVRRFQKSMQGSDLRFGEPPVKKKVAPQQILDVGCRRRGTDPQGNFEKVNWMPRGRHPSN